MLRDALAQHGRFVFSLRGNSMLPTLPEECEIEVVPLPGISRPGQLIVFAAGDLLVAHRLVAIKADLWRAQGDNRRGPDDPLQPEQVLGIVAAARVRGHRVWPRRGEWARAQFYIARYRALAVARRVLRRAGR